ncbi:MAG: transcriptional repressor LexA, partial [Dehalococcoidia bacterium]
TVRDVVKACRMSSTSVADYHLKALVRDGYIHRDAGVSRGIEIMGEERSTTVKAPIIGPIAAGEPLPVPTSDTLTAIDPSDVLEIPQELVRGKENVYALRVKGTSMIDALIDDGDIVLMEYTNTAEDGDTVAAWLEAEEEVTLKKLYREKGRIRLQPANALMQPIYVDPSNISIKGKVIGVIRQLS